MQASLTYNSIVALFGVMAVAAFIPSASTLAVSARSAAYGFVHGVFATMGIVLGDIVFIMLAIYGLSVLAQWMGSHFVFIKYLGGAYLIWLGIVLWRSKSTDGAADDSSESSRLSSFLTGLFITLGDQKAILFYFGFLPAFVDLSAITFVDTVIIILVATIAICVPKLSYAFMADRASMLLKSSKAIKALNIVAGSIMIGVGIFLIVFSK
jgi:threonine/homoserine/homoserine lactone efflux protein